MEGKLNPASIEIIGEETLAIVWSDGHESFYGAPLLRTNCPCAECRVRRDKGRGPAAAPSALSLAMAPPRLIGVKLVGRYAVGLSFSDGHASGIYDLRFLRGLCPCDSCRAGQAP